MASTTTSTITVNSDKFVCVLFSDGTEVSVKPGVILRSELIRDSTGIGDALDGTVRGETFTVVAPEGYLETWLESVSLLNTQGDAHPNVLSIGIDQAVKSLKEAVCTLPWTGEEYMVWILAAGPSETSRYAPDATMCYNAPHYPFPTGRSPLAVQVVQFMEQQLPPGLIVSIVRASEASVGHLLNSLPATLHIAVLEAEFPSLTKHQTLSLNCDHMTPEHAARVLEVANSYGNTDPMDHLNVTNLPVDDFNAQGVSIVHGALWRQLVTACKAATSVSLLLHVSDFFDVVPDHVRAVVAAMAGNSRLASLDMSITVAPDTFLRFDFEGFVPMNRGLRSLAFDIQETMYKRVLCVEVPDAISKLANLTSFELTANLDTEQEVVALLRPLQQLERLSLKHHQGPDTKQVGFSTNACLDVCVNMPRLTSISLCGSFDSDLTSLAQLRRLQSLDCSSSIVQERDAQFLAQVLRQLTNLQNLSLCIQTREGKLLVHVVDALVEAGTCQSLHSLELRSLFTNNQIGSTIREQLLRVPSLKRLAFNVYAYAASSFQQWLQDGPNFPVSLTCLEFRRTREDDSLRDIPDLPEATNGLLDSIGRLKDLQHLTCHLGMHGSICEQHGKVAVCEMLDNLQHLCVANLCEEMFMLGATALAKISTVTRLTVISSKRPRSSREGTDAGGPVFDILKYSTEVGAALATMKNLRVLELSLISCASCPEFWAAVGSLHELQALEFTSHGELASMVSCSVSKLTKLQKLALNYFGSMVSVAADDASDSSPHSTVEKMLRRLPRLEECNLSFCDPDHRDVAAIVSALLELTSLTNISLTNKSIGMLAKHKADIAKAMSPLRSLPKLRELRTRQGDLHLQDHGRSHVVGHSTSEIVCHEDHPGLGNYAAFFGSLFGKMYRTIQNSSIYGSATAQPGDHPLDAL